MANDAAEVAVLAGRVFASVMAPLVLGGALQPAHPIGARRALALLAAAVRPEDADLASRVDLARVTQARRLAPVDTVEEPTGAEWALAAVAHDLLQVTSPAWIRRSAPKRLLDLAMATLARVPPPASAREALSRHTWFARIFDVRRRDTAVSWWVGSSQFLGKEPPKRLFLWSDLRRVSVARADRGLTELLEHGGTAEHAPAFEAALAVFLRSTPLTDLATCARGSPRFLWTPETLALVRAPIPRALGLRAAALAPVEDADAALGHATRLLLAAKAWRGAALAIDFLGHRAMASAQAGGAGERAGAQDASAEAAEDAAFARAAGAIAARRWIDDAALVLPDHERRRLAPIFDAAARTGAARELAELMGPAAATPPA